MAENSEGDLSLSDGLQRALDARERPLEPLPEDLTPESVRELSAAELELRLDDKRDEWRLCWVERDAKDKRERRGSGVIEDIGAWDGFALSWLLDRQWEQPMLLGPRLVEPESFWWYQGRILVVAHRTPFDPLWRPGGRIEVGFDDPRRRPLSKRLWMQIPAVSELAAAAGLNEPAGYERFAALRERLPDPCGVARRGRREVMSAVGTERIGDLAGDLAEPLGIFNSDLIDPTDSKPLGEVVEDRGNDRWAIEDKNGRSAAELSSTDLALLLDRQWDEPVMLAGASGDEDEDGMLTDTAYWAHRGQLVTLWLKGVRLDHPATDDLKAVLTVFATHWKRGVSRDATRGLRELRSRLPSSPHAAFNIQAPGAQRMHIPQQVRTVVWRRDGGRCTECGSRENLEYDHIIPVSKGGSNTPRNLRLLCQTCNRRKGATI